MERNDLQTRCEQGRVSRRSLRPMVALLIALLATSVACSGEAGDGESTDTSSASSTWDEMSWDEGAWQ